jgi:hypothetical protein
VSIRSAGESHVPVMRWVYARGDERLTCELSLDSSNVLYELRVQPAEALASTRVDRFVHAGSAFIRQCELEADWIHTGWTLEEYSSDARPPQSDRPAEPTPTLAQDR